MEQADNVFDTRERVYLAPKVSGTINRVPNRLSFGEDT